MLKKNLVLQMTELENAADFLENALDHLENLGDKKIEWKWVFIALNGALYGFMLCALQGTNLLDVIQRTGEETVEDLLQSLGTSHNAIRFIGVHEAVTLCQKRGYINLDKEQQESIAFFIDGLCNPFEQNIPGGWSIVLNDVPKICREVFALILQLVENTNEFKHRWSSPGKRKKAIARCRTGIRLLKKLEKEYKKHNGPAKVSII